MKFRLFLFNLLVSIIAAPVEHSYELPAQDARISDSLSLDDILKRDLEDKHQNWSVAQKVTWKMIKSLLSQTHQSASLLRSKVPVIQVLPLYWSLSLTVITIPRSRNHNLDQIGGIDIDNDRQIYFDMIKPSTYTPETGTLILYLYGGAFIFGNRILYRNIATGSLAKYSDSAVICPDYSKAPEDPFPNALIDVLSVYLHILDPKSGIKFKKIIFMGESAGGGLCISLMLYLRDHNLRLPDAIIGLSPWLDLTFSHPSAIINRPYDYITSMLGDENTIRDRKWLNDEQLFY